MGFYDFSAVKMDGTEVSMSQYNGDVVLVVNTATKCGLAPQFKELEAIYQTYKDQGLVILGFPSNQFHQEPDSGEKAAEACRMTYGVTFPMHTLTVINGKEADPLFLYLEEQAPGLLTNDIKWNFTKFLINREGEVVERFAPKTSPKEMIDPIEKALG